MGVCLSTKLVNKIQTEPFQYYHHTWYIYSLWQEDVTYWFSRSGVKGQGHTLHIVVKPCKQDTDWNVSARTVKLGTYFLWQKDNSYNVLLSRSGVKGRGHTLSIVVNLVNMIQNEPFQLDPSNLVHILLMTRGQRLLIFKDRGQRSRSHTNHCC